MTVILGGFAALCRWCFGNRNLTMVSKRDPDLPANGKKSKKQKKGSGQAQGVITGRGDYRGFVTSLKQALKPVMKEAIISSAAALGTASGVPGGAQMGKFLGAKISKLMGSGDYTTNSPRFNSLFSKDTKGLPLQFAGDDKRVRIFHREFLGDFTVTEDMNTLTNPDNFGVITFQLNPGLCQTFPFLNKTANNYTEYYFGGLAFEYVSTTSAYSANPGMGSVVLSANYNPYQAPYTTKVDMENSAYALSARPDVCMVYGIECAESRNTQNVYFVRNGPTEAPVTATDYGTFQIGCATSIPVGTKLAEIWALVDVTLSAPRQGINMSPSAHWSGQMKDNGTHNMSITGSLPGYSNVYGITVAAVNDAHWGVGITVSNVCNGDVLCFNIGFQPDSGVSGDAYIVDSANCVNLNLVNVSDYSGAMWVPTATSSEWEPPLPMGGGSTTQVIARARVPIGTGTTSAPTNNVFLKINTNNPGGSAINWFVIVSKVGQGLSDF